MDITLPEASISKKRLTFWETILTAFTFLIAASLLYPSISNPIIGIVIGVPFIIFASYILLKKYDSFSFLLVVFFCAHFRFYDVLWVYLFLGLLLSFNLKEILNLKKESNIFLFIFKCLFVLNLIGLLFNSTASHTDKILGLTIFSSYFLIFYFLLNYKIQQQDVKRFFQVIAFLIIYQLATAILQKLMIFSIDLPYLPLLVTYDGPLANINGFRASGLMGDFELLAEYCAFLLTILLSVSFYKDISSIISRRILFSLIGILFITILLTGTRSSILMIGAVIVILLLLHFRLLFSIRFWIGAIILFLGFNFLINNSQGLNLKMVFDRFSNIDLKHSENESSDELINREVTFSYAYKRLASASWIIGDGYTIGASYKASLFYPDPAPEVGDYHSLYLSMPIFFGWIGSFFFVTLFLCSLFFFIRNALKAKKGSFAFYISLGLFLSWFFLFINEYKIQFIRYPNYFFLIWFWLSISLNISKNVRDEDYYSW